MASAAAGRAARRAAATAAATAGLWLAACGPGPADRQAPPSRPQAPGAPVAPRTDAAPAVDAASLASRRYDCMRCHDRVIRQVGPGFAQVAQRYRNDPDAADRLAAKIREGSVGAWGRLVMPRHPQVTPADAQAMARWILGQPSPP